MNAKYAGLFQNSRSSNPSQNARDKLVQSQLKKLIRNSLAPRVFNRTQRILDHYFHQHFPSPGLQTSLTKLHIQINVNLMQHIPHIQRLRVRQHDELDTRRRLVVMQLILSRPEADEAIIWTAELAHHVPQREDRAEDELCVILCGKTGWTGACWTEIWGCECLA